MRSVSSFPFRIKKCSTLGGADGTFCKVFHEELGVEAINLDFDIKNVRWLQTVRGVTHKLPFNDNEFDFVMCRGVLEHIPPERQQSTLNEINRVTKTGGICYIDIPPWYNLFAGHALRPFHLFPFKIAKRLTLFFYKNPPIYHAARSYAELLLFPITFKKMSQMIVRSGMRLLATKDNHFGLDFLGKIPIIREIAIPAVVFIVRKQLPKK